MVDEEVKNDETVIGVHGTGIDLEEGRTQTFRFYCSNCKRDIHSHVKVDDGKAEIVFTCTNDNCQCKCKTHFECKKLGKLHLHGTKCNCIVEDEILHSSEDEKKFQKIMDGWREDHQPVKIKENV